MKLFDEMLMLKLKKYQKKATARKETITYLIKQNKQLKEEVSKRGKIIKHLQKVGMEKVLGV